MTTFAVETSGLAKTYRSRWRKPTLALTGVSLQVEPGMIFGLLGQNGAGKTTLVKILLGLVPPTGGQARVFEHDPGDASTRRRIGYLPEQMRLPEFLKAEGFLGYMGRLNHVDARTLRQRVPQLLEQVGLANGGARKKFFREYSKGMQQRIGLAQALVNDPDLLFLDEPTEGLDPLGRKNVRDLLVRLRDVGKTIFLNSHVLSEVEQVCDRVVILNRGEVVKVGKPEELTRSGGEYRVRLAAVGDAVRQALAAAVDSARWEGNAVVFRPRDLAHLNAVIDRLRAVPVEIEAVEPVRSTLEQYFIELLKRSES